SRFAWPAGPDERFDFTQLLDGWEIISGAWGIEDVPGASRDGRVLVQRATNNKFNVILAPSGPYGDVDVSVRFKPISGWDDASGGIVFRFSLVVPRNKRHSCWKGKSRIIKRSPGSRWATMPITCAWTRSAIACLWHMAMAHWRSSIQPGEARLP